LKLNLPLCHQAKLHLPQANLVNDFIEDGTIIPQNPVLFNIKIENSLAQQALL